MAALAYPARAFFPASLSKLNRHTATPRKSAGCPTLATARRCYSTCSRGSWLSLSATDQTEDATRAAEDAAKAAVLAGVKVLNQVIADVGSNKVDVDKADVVRTMANAARATAQSALASLESKIERASLAAEEEGAGDTTDVFVPREDVVGSPGRIVVEVALSSTTARDAARAAQAALQRQDSAAAELGLSAKDGLGTASVATSDVSKTGATHGGVRVDAPDDEGEEDLMGKEPDSARTTRNSPAASHSHLSHLLWRQVAGPGDTVVDCTAGNGHDTLELAKIVALNDGVGKLYAMDVQDRALEATLARLESELGRMATKRSTLVKGNFCQLPAELGACSVQLIVYNLGWLPGGDKSITTVLEDTLESIDSAKRLVKSGGMISIMLYQGHPEGKRETEAVLEYAAGLPHNRWRVFVHDRVNRTGSPVLLTIYKL